MTPRKRGQITRSHHRKYDDMCEDVVGVLQGICDAIGVPAYVTSERPKQPPPGAAWRPDDGIVDEVAVARACDRGGIKLTRLEAVEAVRRLAVRGLSDPEIAHRIGVTDRTVQRLRARYGIATGYRSDDFAELMDRRRRGVMSA